MGFRPCERSTRQVPQDELAVFADRSDPESALFAPARIPRDTCHPGRVPLAVRNDVLLEGSIHRHEIVLTAGLAREREQGERSAFLREGGKTSNTGRLTTTKRPSGLQATQLMAPK